MGKALRARSAEPRHRRHVQNYSRRRDRRFRRNRVLRSRPGSLYACRAVARHRCSSGLRPKEDGSLGIRFQDARPTRRARARRPWLFLLSLPLRPVRGGPWGRPSYDDNESRPYRNGASKSAALIASAARSAALIASAARPTGMPQVQTSAPEDKRRCCRFITCEGRVNGGARFRLPRRFPQEKFGWPQRGAGDGSAERVTKATKGAFRTLPCDPPVLPAGRSPAVAIDAALSGRAGRLLKGVLSGRATEG